MSNDLSQSRHGEFVTLFASHAQRLYGYIYAQLGRASDADDVFQETSLVLWEKFEEFESGTNFYAWACRTAHFQVLAYTQKQRRSRLMFSDEFIASVAEQTKSDEDALMEQHLALSNCIKKLKDRDRELVTLRYSPGATTKNVAEKLGRSIDAVYKSLNRLQERLIECTQEAILKDGMETKTQ